METAACFQEIREKHETFSDYLWGFTDNKAVIYKGHETGLILASHAKSLSRARTNESFYPKNYLADTPQRGNA